MDRNRTWEKVIILLLTVSLGLNVVVLGRLKTLEVLQGQISGLQGSLATVLHHVSTVDSRLANMEREAKWMTDFAWDIDMDQVSQRNEPIPVSLRWALKDVPVGARVFVSYGPQDDSTWFETDALTDTEGRFQAELLLDPAVAWGFLVVADDGHTRKTSDRVSLDLAGILESPFYATLNHRQEMEIMRRPPPRFEWQAVESLTAQFSHDGEEVDAIFEPLDPSGESERELWTLKVPEGVTQIVITVRYVDGHLDEAVLDLDGRPVDEPLFPSGRLTRTGL